MQTLTLVWGILAVVGMVVAFFPCLGSLNWLNIPFAGIGLIVGFVTMAGAAGPKKGNAMVGTILCGIAVVIGLIRLSLGGGIL